MLSSKKKLQRVTAFATLFPFALGVGCSGFFVDPVLTSIALGPTATINVKTLWLPAHLPLRLEARIHQPLQRHQ
jgi:hypothetical protein